MNKSEPKVLITGGLGFIGAHLARFYIHKGATVVLLDKGNERQSSFFEMGFNNHPNLQVLNGDILNDSFLKDLGTDFDVIIHAAGILGIQKVCEQPFLTADVNVFGTRKILDFAIRQKKLTRFLLFSTSEVYGKEAFWAEENSPSIIPNKGSRWIYASSKQFSEYLLKAFIHEFNVPGIIVRPFNIYGPYRKGSNAITTFVMKALNNEQIVISGSGNQVRAWCHIDDFIEGIHKMIIKENIIGEAFNLGNSDQPISILDLANLVCAQLNSKSEVVVSHNDTDDVQNRIPNIEKARNLLGFSPKISLTEGIHSLFVWLSQFQRINA